MSTEQPAEPEASPPAQEPSPEHTPHESRLTHRLVVPTSTLVLGGILLVLVGFGVGLLIGHHQGRSALAFPFDGRRMAQGGYGMPGGVAPGHGMPGFDMPDRFPGSVGDVPSASGSFGGAAAGVVTRVDGSTIYVKTIRGQEVAVQTDGSTLVRLATAGEVADLVPGSSIFITGVAGPDGTLIASRVFEGAASGSSSAQGSGSG